MRNPKTIVAIVAAGALAASAMLLCEPKPVGAQNQQLQVASISVGPDQTLIYPNATSGANQLTGLADEHTTFFGPATGGGPYLVWAAATPSTATGNWGAVLLQTNDLKTFSLATPPGSTLPEITSEFAFSKCSTTDNTLFDENYAAPGSVLQDPTLPPGNLIMLYEAENHCPGGVFQEAFYATVGFTRSSDNGKTWPPVQSGPLGGPSRHPVLQAPEPPPTSAHGYLGNAIPSGFVDKSLDGNHYLYVAYTYFSSSGQSVRVARAQLGQDPLNFQKWYNGSFSQPGIGGMDTPVLPSNICNTQQASPELSYLDDLGLYTLMYKCYYGPMTARLGGWYYSTATSLDLQDWTPPRLIEGSEYPLIAPCPGQTTGADFDGFYPSTVSPGAATGHLKGTGYVFFSHVACTLAARQFLSRTFTIAAQPQPAPVLNAASLANGATYLPGGLVPGSWAQVKGTGLANVTRSWTGFDFLNLGASLPTSLSGVRVMVNNLPAAVYYISPTQINFQVPSGVTGTASVQVINNGTASNTVTAGSAASAPGLFSYSVSGTNYPSAVFFPDGHYVGDPMVNAVYRNAKPGDVIELYATGLASEPGGVLPAAQGITGVTVTIGGITVPALFAGQVANAVEFQINFTLPQQFASMAAGNYPLTVAVNGVSSPANINSNPSGPIVIPIQPK